MNNVIDIGMTQKVAGYISAKVLNAEGAVVREVPEFRNLIVNGGLDYFMANLNSGFVSLATYVKVGTGTGTPANTDTTLPGFLAAQGITAQAGAFQTATAPYYFEATYTYLFPLGAINATLTCIGVYTTSAGANIHAWSQIKDSGNNPTTLTILSSEQLSITYKFRVYAPAFSTSGTITIAGDGDHSFTTFAHSFSTGAYGSVDGNVKPLTDQIQATRWTTFTDPVNILSAPAITGQNTRSMTMTYSTYTAGTFTRNITGFMDTATNVTSNDINGFILNCVSSTGTGPLYLMKLATPIPKDTTKTLNITFAITLARYP